MRQNISYWNCLLESFQAVRDLVWTSLSFGRGRGSYLPAAPGEPIRRRAFEPYVLRGNQSGSELDDWLQAEKEFLQDEAIDEEAAEVFGQP